MSKIIFFPIETINRELDSRLIITTEALKSGYEVVVGEKSEVIAYAKEKSNGIILYKDFSSQSEKLFKSLKLVGIRIYAIDEEGLVWLNSDDYLTRVSIESIRQCEKIFLWGDTQLSLLKSKLNYDSDKLIMIGNPRIDLLHEKFSHFHLLESSNYIAKHRKFIIVITNFPAAHWNPRLYGSENYLVHQLNRGRAVSEKQVEFFEKQVEYQKLLSQEYNIMLGKLKNDFPEYDLIIRPHPDEDSSYYEKIINQNANVFMNRSGCTSHWLFNSSAVIFSGSTTGIEAYLMGKNIHWYNPFDNYDLETQLPNTLTEQIKNYYDLQLSIKKSIDEKCDSSGRSIKPLNSFIDFRNWGHSYKIIFEIMNEGYPTTKPESTRKRNISSAVKLKSIRLLRINVIGNSIYLFIRNSQRLDKTSKYSKLKSKILVRKLTHLNTSLNADQKIKVRKIGNQLFSIRINSV